MGAFRNMASSMPSVLGTEELKISMAVLASYLKKPWPSSLVEVHFLLSLSPLMYHAQGNRGRKQHLFLWGVIVRGASSLPHPNPIPDLLVQTLREIAQSSGPGVHSIILPGQVPLGDEYPWSVSLRQQLFLPKKMISTVGSDTWPALAMSGQSWSPCTLLLAEHHRRGRQIHRRQQQADRECGEQTGTAKSGMSPALLLTPPRTLLHTFLYHFHFASFSNSKKKN